MFIPIVAAVAVGALTLRSPRQERQLAGTPLTIYLTTDEDAAYHRQWWYDRGYYVATLYIDRQPNVVLVPRNR